VRLAGAAVRGCDWWSIRMQDLSAGRRLPGRLHDFRRVVLLSDDRASRVSLPLLGVQLPGRIVRQPIVPVLHEHGRALYTAPALGRPAVHVPAGRGADPEPELALAHEPLASRAHERDRLGEENAHRVP
jgi:hypothetical protein